PKPRWEIHCLNYLVSVELLTGDYLRPRNHLLLRTFYGHGDFPDPHRVGEGACHDGLTIRAKDRFGDEAAVFERRAARLPRGRVPEARAFVFTPGQGQQAVRAEGNAADDVVVRQGGTSLSRARLPEASTLVPASRHDQAIVGAKSHGVHGS